MIGAHLGTMLDQLRVDGMEYVADCLADAVLHDYHDDWHDGEFYRDCWFCWHESQNGYGDWPHPGPPPERKVDEQV